MCVCVCVCVCVYIYIYIYIYIYTVYTVVFKIIAVFKKASKAQNPYNNFNFNTHKCIGNIAHSILNQNMKKNLANFFITLQKVKKNLY